MKILLDECVTKRLKALLPEFEVFTVSEMRWNGLKNGRLVSRCVAHGFDVLLTIDKNMVHQQNMERYDIALVVLDSQSSKLEELRLFLPPLRAAINSLRKGDVQVIGR